MDSTQLGISGPEWVTTEQAPAWTRHSASFPYVGRDIAFLLAPPKRRADQGRRPDAVIAGILSLLTSHA